MPNVDLSNSEEGPRTAPAASDPTVMKNVMPLKPGQVIPDDGRNPHKVATLQADSQEAPRDVPTHIADQAAEIASDVAVEEFEAAAKLAQGGDQLEIEMVDIEHLHPDEAARVRKGMMETIQANAGGPPDLSNVKAEPPASARRDPPPPPEAPDIHSQAVPGYEPHAGYQPQVANPRAYPTQPGVVPDEPPEPQAQVEVEADLPPANERKEEPLDTFGGPVRTHCSHCGFPLDQEDDIEPSTHDKRAFLHAVLGQKPFTKEYPLFDGAVKVRFRTLTTHEVDTIYRQVAAENLGEFDYVERINRYRLFLQLQRLEGGEHLFHELPEGFTPATNPNAATHYELPPLKEGETGLLLVEQYVNTTVLPTESLMRAVQNCCRQFNRLTSKLEARVDNPDFWKTTG